MAIQSQCDYKSKHKYRKYSHYVIVSMNSNADSRYYEITCVKTNADNTVNI